MSHGILQAIISMGTQKIISIGLNKWAKRYNQKQLEGDILTHNHSSGSTFSREDIFNLYATNMAELRAVTSNKIYSIKKIGDFNYYHWYDNYLKIIEDFKFKFADKIKNGMSFEDRVLMQEELFTKSFEGYNVQFTIQQ